MVVVDLWPARWSLWLLGAAGAAAVLAHVAAGHAASPSSVWFLNILVQWVHMTAVGVWVGGLFWLLLGFRGREHDARLRRRSPSSPHRHRLSSDGLLRWAVAAKRVVSALFDTRYGITLVVKILLVVGLCRPRRP